MGSSEYFPTDTEHLSSASVPERIRLAGGDRLDLRIAAVEKRIAGSPVRMLAYNGSIPGPTLLVDEGSEIGVDVTNDGDVETTVHWHGLRLENRYDGVPHETQDPIPVGGSYSYRLQFPDPGFYWYHPHIREDVAQEMGLYGTIVVEPRDPSYWPPVDRFLTITIDDILLEDGRIVPFLRSGPTFTAMGRFGNELLVNGEPRLTATGSPGEVVRLFLVNTANTRLFNVVIDGARAKLVGGDSGRVERESFVDEVLVAPSERAVVDVLLEHPGEVRLLHRSPERGWELGSISVGPTPAPGTAASSFDTLRTAPELAVERERIALDLQRPPDETLAFIASMPLLYGEPQRQASSYVCPMHPSVTSVEPGTCPECGMKLIPADDTAAAPVSRDGHEHHDPQDHGDHGDHGGSDGLEWEDLMPEINRASDPSNMIWKLVDRSDGAENAAIDWSFSLGDRVKIRLVNEMDSDHPMHHPFHIHGAGRFLVVARDDVPEPNLVWKDTVLVAAGETVDIVLDVSNPGLWMAHCHIAEHTESGMMFSFNVTRAGTPAG